MPILLAASKKNITKSMLHNYAKRQSGNVGHVTIASFKNRQTFTDIMEDGLADYILKCLEIFHELTTASTQRSTYEYAIANNI